MTPPFRTFLIAVFCFLAVGLGAARINAQYNVGDQVDAPFRHGLTLAFKGGALDGQDATYHQASDSPTHTEPTAITLTNAGERCDRPIK